MKAKVAKVMREYKSGKLKSSSGDKVKSRDQARERIAEGSKEKMRKPGSPGAPTDAQFKQAAKTAMKPKKK